MSTTTAAFKKQSESAWEKQKIIQIDTSNDEWHACKEEGLTIWGVIYIQIGDIVFCCTLANI